MNRTFDIDVININRERLVKGLYYDIFEPMNELLTSNEIAEIKRHDTLEKQVDTLLDIIVNKPINWPLDVFKNYLKKYYNWLYILFDHRLAEMNLMDVLNEGGVPALAERNVTRSSLLNEIRSKLSKLGVHKRFLVIHGLMGCGKTSLAAQVLYDINLVDITFQRYVYWVTVGVIKRDEIHKLQEDLNARLPDPEPNLSPNISTALVQLRQRFMESRKKCLIVLDDVHSEAVIDYLNVGVRILVTSRDMNIIKNNKSITDFVKVPDGFKELESLELFASSLEVCINELPEVEPKEIHKYCKGHPMTVALIGAELADHKEDVRKNSNRWFHYVKILKDPHSRKMSLKMESSQYINNAIKLALDNLTPRLKSCFEHFALFPKDINLKPEVLATIWSMEKFEVENIMAEFQKKSLVVRIWNQTLNSYVYGVHDLFLDYLNLDNVLSPDRIKEMHRTLVDKYMERCSWDASKLPKNDNYIFYYLAYHLKCAGLDSELPNIYVDLEFLEAKLRAVEPSDLIRDFRRYDKSIVTENNREMVMNIRNFIEWYGPLIHEGMDIGQLALQEPSNSFIYKSGLELVKKRLSDSGHPYVTFPLGPVERRNWLPKTINFKGKSISAMCFTVTGDCIAVATKGGYLELRSLNCNHFKIFKGHTDDITRLAVSLDGERLLSSSKDCTIKAWKLTDTNLVKGDRTPSPSQTQDSYHNFWSSQRRGDRPAVTLDLDGPVFWVALSQTEHTAAVHSHHSSTALTVFLNYSIQWTKEIPGLKICEFNQEGKFIFAGGDNGVEIIDSLISTSKNLIKTPVIGLSSLRNSLNDGLVTVTETRVDFWANDTTGETNTSCLLTKRIEEKGAKYVQFHGGHHIALVTDSNDIVVLDNDTGSILEHISGQDHESNVIGVVVKKGMLLTAYSNSTIEIKPIGIADVPKSSICWPSPELNPFVAQVENLVDLKVFQGLKKTAAHRSQVQITNLAFMSSDDLNRVGYSTCNGDVYVVDQEGNLIYLKNFKFSNPVSFITFFKHKGVTYLAASTPYDSLKTIYFTHRRTPDREHNVLQALLFGQWEPGSKPGNAKQEYLHSLF